MTDLLTKFAQQLTSVLDETIKEQGDLVYEIAMQISGRLNSGGKLLLCGNGGSAADCQHIAAEFVNRFSLERRALPAIALTTDTSVLTSIANDFSFSQVFERQVEALGDPGDFLLGISTSGNSENVLNALKKAQDQGMKTIGFTGSQGSAMSACCDYLVKVHSRETPRIQDVHIFLGHVICDLVERMVFEK